MKLLGRKEIWEAVAIAALTALATKLVELFGDEVKRRRKKDEKTDEKTEEKKSWQG